MRPPTQARGISTAFLLAAAGLSVLLAGVPSASADDCYYVMSCYSCESLQGGGHHRDRMPDPFIRAQYKLFCTGVALEEGGSSTTIR